MSQTDEKICNFWIENCFQKLIVEYEQNPIADLNSGSAVHKPDTSTTELRRCSTK